MQAIEGAFKQSKWGRALESELAQPFQGSERQMRSLVTTKYGLPWQQALKACMGREWRLFYRNSFAFYSSTFQVGFLFLANDGVLLLSTMGASRPKLCTLRATFQACHLGYMQLP